MAINSTIVQLATTVTTAPTPSTLQQSGAFVSIGGTTQDVGTYAYYGTLAELQGAVSSSGNYLEIGYMGNTFFAQPNQLIGVYVLELGTQGSSSTGIAALSTWITANPNVFYAYLTPASWDSSGATLNALAANYTDPSAKTYFFVTTTSGTISAYATTKSVWSTVPSPTAGASEFQSAAPFYDWLANNPQAASPAAPMGYRYVYGVTPWAQTGNQATIGAILTAFGNVIETGAEGGIDTSCIFKGTMMDGNQAMFWYAVDWFQIQAKQQMAAAIINGSNTNPPLYYNQVGINKLLAILENIGNTGISFGLLLNATPSAVPFSTYVATNPSDYAAGNYAGFSALVTPQNQFLTITVFLDATQFVSG